MLAAALLAAGAGWEAQAPALRACLDGAGAAAFATAALPTAEGRVLVRLWRPGHAGAPAGEDCLATPAGAVLARRGLAAGTPPPDPAAPAFFLDRRCADARRVQASDGAVLGWLAYPGC